MADKFYLIRKSVNTGAIRLKADVVTDYEFMKVTGLNVASVDTLIASINDDNWMSADIADSSAQEGYTADGVTLPKKAVDS
jgi:hypothetical protein